MGNTTYWKHRPGQARHAVPLGSQSDVFFVFVRNLPKGVDHRNLRNTATQAAKVEKCFIYPNSSDGYVRVRGWENACKLSNHLNSLQISNSTQHASLMSQHEPIHPQWNPSAGVPAPIPGYYGGEAELASFVPGDANPDGGHGGYHHGYEYGQGLSSGGAGSTDSRSASPAGSSSGGQQPYDIEWERALARLVLDGRSDYGIAMDKRDREEQQHAALSS